MKRDKHNLAIYNKYNVNKTNALLSGCIVYYNDSSIRAFIGIYAITSGFCFLAIVKGLVAKSNVLLDGFSDFIALDDMDCNKTGYSQQNKRVIKHTFLLPGYLGIIWGRLGYISVVRSNVAQVYSL